jgi:DNA-binding protein H-NS
LRRKTHNVYFIPHRAGRKKQRNYDKEKKANHIHCNHCGCTWDGVGGVTAEYESWLNQSLSKEKQEEVTATCGKAPGNYMAVKKQAKK